MYEEFVKLENSVPVLISRRQNDVPESDLPVGIISLMHLHKEYEILYGKRGKIKCIMPTCEYVINEGDMIFINSYIPHSTYRLTNGAYTDMLQFDINIYTDTTLRYLNRFFNSHNNQGTVFVKGTNAARELLTCFNRIKDEYTDRNDYWSEYIYSDIYMIMSILKRYGAISDGSYKKNDEISKIKPVIDYINDNYDEHITTSLLSNMLNFNESYFCRVFKNAIGTSAMDYVNYVRVCRAEHYLRKGDLISEVAYKSGFSSLSYFNRIFRKYTHFSPSEYRKITNSGVQIHKEYGVF